MKHPIFYDPFEKRHSRAKYSILFFLVLIGILLFIFILSIFFHPILPLPAVFRDMIARNSHHHTTKLPQIPKPTVRKRVSNNNNFSQTGTLQKEKVYAFGVEWDDASYASLETNGEKIDTLILEELTINTGGLKVLNPEKMKRTLDHLDSTDPDLPRVALVNNFDEITNIWNKELLF
jgi:peptidoglycan-N-acetylglucosamine deacetylase